MRLFALRRTIGRAETRGLTHAYGHAGSRGQAIVEAALSLPLLVLMFAVVVTAGQVIGYTVDLTNAAGAGAVAAAHAAAGSEGSPAQAAIVAVNEEQDSRSWAGCPGGSQPQQQCVTVTSTSRETAPGVSVGLEVVVVHGSFTPLFDFLGLSLPINVSAGASV